MLKYYVKQGYFGQQGRKEIPKWKALLYQWFTNIAVYLENEGKEIWWE